MQYDVLWRNIDVYVISCPNSTFTIGTLRTRYSCRNRAAIGTNGLYHAERTFTIPNDIADDSNNDDVTTSGPEHRLTSTQAIHIQCRIPDIWIVREDIEHIFWGHFLRYKQWHSGVIGYFGEIWVIMGWLCLSRMFVDVVRLFWGQGRSCR